jgi:hypothetical protein
MELHGNRKGAVLLRLHDNKSALLIPYFETDCFVDHNLRRFDYLICLGISVKAVCLQPLENMIVEHMSP